MAAHQCPSATTGPHTPSTPPQPSAHKSAVRCAVSAKCARGLHTAASARIVPGVRGGGGGAQFVEMPPGQLCHMDQMETLGMGSDRGCI